MTSGKPMLRPALGASARSNGQTGLVETNSFLRGE
jgi:hypothetical protein